MIDSFRDRRVLVTGSTGFKGAWLCAWLERLGAAVTGFALPAPSAEEGPNLFRLLQPRLRMRQVYGDVRDLPAVRRALAESGAEFVFHLAAQPLVRKSYAEPKETFDVNVGGTVNVCEAVRLSAAAGGPVRVLVNVTSDKVYENREWVWGYRECDPLGGADPYSASKAASEIAFAGYVRSFLAKQPKGGHAVAAASARAGNVIGGGDWAADRIVPDCIRALSAGSPAVIRRPAAVRPWQHVLEPLSGYLTLAAALRRDPARFAGAWNFGPDAEGCRTVAELADAVIAAWGSGRRESPASPEGLAEAGVLKLCSDKARAELGWRPAWGFAEAVARTVEWYRDWHRDPSSAAETTLRQIGEYEQAGGR
jgi:CDP-glucose 4,6-dehydratase